MMLTLEKLYAEYKATTVQLSDNTRKLNFAGIAIIWILKVGTDKCGGIPFEPILYYPLLGLIVSLFIDLLQYLVKATMINCFHWEKEKELLSISDEGKQALSTSETEFLAPEYIRITSDVFFYLKISLTVIAFIAIISYFISKLFF